MRRSRLGEDRVALERGFRHRAHFTASTSLPSTLAAREPLERVAAAPSNGTGASSGTRSTPRARCASSSSCARALDLAAVAARDHADDRVVARDHVRRIHAPPAPAREADQQQPPLVRDGSAWPPRTRRRRPCRRRRRRPAPPWPRAPPRRARRPGSNASSAPSSRQNAWRSSPRAVAITRAPSARPSWIAAEPVPPAPPSTSSVSPARSAPRCTRPIHAV